MENQRRHCAGEKLQYLFFAYIAGNERKTALGDLQYYPRNGVRLCEL
jgi:hypothetical protein